MDATDGSPQPHSRAAPSAEPERPERTRPAPRDAPGAQRVADERLRRAMAIETVGIVFFDAHGAILDCNDAFLRISGLARAALARQRVGWESIVAPASWPAAERALAQYREIGRIAPAEMEYVRPDGSRWWALFSATRLDADQGVGYLIDVTDRKQAEASQRATEAEFRTMFELSSVGQCQIALGNGVIVRANLRFCHMVGHAADELARMRLEDLVHPADRSTAMAMLQSLVLAQVQEPSFEMRLVRGDGTVVWVEGNVTLMRDEFGAPVRVAAIVRDVTAQKQTEQALAESRERLRLILESARDYAIISMDMARRVTSWNPGAERITGYADAEMLGQSADAIFTESDRARGEPEREWRTALTSGRAVDERWHRRKDGSLFWGSGVMMVMHDLQGEPVGTVKIFRDETEARRSSEALKESRAQLWEALRENERAREELQAASQAKDHFLSVLSHELRTPLTPVLMAAQALGMRHDLPEGVRPALEMIQRNVRIEAHFIDDLLDLTRISRGKLELAQERLDLHQTVRAAVAACKPHIEQKGIAFEVALQAERCAVDGDPARLHQTVVNLLRNAIKFTPEGGTIAVSSANAGDRFRLVVTDTGIGIDSERMPGIFEAFNQGGEWVAQEYGGLGLGLAIARATVEAHGGSIRADSAGTNRGTTLTVEIPLAPETGKSNSGTPSA